VKNSLTNFRKFPEKKNKFRKFPNLWESSYLVQGCKNGLQHPRFWFSFTNKILKSQNNKVFLKNKTLKIQILDPQLQQKIVAFQSNYLRL